MLTIAYRTVHDAHASAAIDWLVRAHDATADGGLRGIRTSALPSGEPFPRREARVREAPAGNAFSPATTSLRP
jgi:hypothetical protein